MSDPWQALPRQNPDEFIAWLDTVDELAAVYWDRDVASESPDVWPLYWAMHAADIFDQMDPQRYYYVVWTSDGSYWTWVTEDDESRWRSRAEDADSSTDNFVETWSQSVITRYRDLTKD